MNVVTHQKQIYTQHSLKLTKKLTIGLIFINFYFIF